MGGHWSWRLVTFVYHTVISRCCSWENLFAWYSCKFIYTYTHLICILLSCSIVIDNNLIANQILCLHNAIAKLYQQLNIFDGIGELLQFEFPQVASQQTDMCFEVHQWCFWVFNFQFAFYLIWGAQFLFSAGSPLFQFVPFFVWRKAQSFHKFNFQVREKKLQCLGCRLRQWIFGQ